MKLFEINATKAKQFYVEAKSQKDAVESQEVDIETRFRGDQFDWNTSRQRQPKLLENRLNG